MQYALTKLLIKLTVFYGPAGPMDTCFKVRVERLALVGVIALIAGHAYNFFQIINYGVLRRAACRICLAVSAFTATGKGGPEPSPRFNEGRNRIALAGLSGGSER
jgi:hypothetical protein